MSITQKLEIGYENIVKNIKNLNFKTKFQFLVLLKFNFRNCLNKFIIHFLKLNFTPNKSKLKFTFGIDISTCINLIPKLNFIDIVK